VTAPPRARISASRLLQSPALNWFSSKVAHLVGPARLYRIYLQSALFTASPSEALEAVLGESIDYTEEFAHIREPLDAELANTDKGYPDDYMIEDSSAVLLYTLVRHTKPALAVEVGVADGRSTGVILCAMDANDAGRLVSVDIDPDVGGAARGHPRWSLRVHSPNRPPGEQLASLLGEVGPPDLFFHDGSHTYYDQHAEYIAAMEHMRPGSLFVSDDVDWSYAFVDFTAAFSVKPVVLTEGHKVVGMFRHP
jgi:predicted O-methyltransferase YrrM